METTSARTADRAGITTSKEQSRKGRRSPRKKMPYPAHVPARIARLRRKNHLTQQQVADYMGVRQQTYSEYERGESAMHIEEFLLLARLFNVSVDFITGASNIIREFPRV